MPEIAILSNTGEIKIPLRVRTRLGLQPGQKLDVKIEGQNVVLTAIGPPAPESAIREFLQWKKKNNPQPSRLNLRPTKSKTRKPTRTASRKKKT